MNEKQIAERFKPMPVLEDFAPSVKEEKRRQFWYKIRRLGLFGISLIEWVLIVGVVLIAIWSV